MTVKDAEERSLRNPFTLLLFEMTVHVKNGYLGVLLIIPPAFHVRADEAQ